MRDAIGGSSLLYLVIIFVTVVMLMFASILTYSKAYRVKNRIIELIEKYEKYEKKDGAYDAVDAINPDLKNAGYNSSNPTRCTVVRNDLTNSSDGKYIASDLSQNLNKNYGYNYCVFEVCDERDSAGKCIATDGRYYVVVTFVEFQFPIIGDVLTIPVYGETKILGKSYNYE